MLRCTGDELERRYRGDLAAQVSVLLLCGGDRVERRRSLTAISEELFSNGVNWGRIVAMMELGGALCTEVVRRGGAWQVDDITDWMEDTLDSPPLQGWIEANGGWVGGALRSFGLGLGFRPAGCLEKSSLSSRGPGSSSRTF